MVKPVPVDPVGATSRPTERKLGVARAARQESLRFHNLGLVLREVLDSPVPLSRADVAASTGLTRATVSSLVEELLQARLLRELGPVSGQRVGRPAVPLVAARGTVAAVGAEINVDYLGVCALDLAGEVLVQHLVHDDFRHSDPGPVIDRLAEMAAGVLTTLSDRDVSVAGIALALPGLVDSVTGPLRLAPNLGWHDVDVLARLTEHPVLAAFAPRLGNEANLAANAEQHARRQRGPRSFVYVSGEVGIGGAIVLEGAIFGGMRGWSGEIGHVAVGTDGRFDAGDRLEAYAGQDALLAAAGLPRSAEVEELSRAGAAGQRAIGRAADAMGLVLSSVMNIVDVHHVVLGGIYAGLADGLRPGIEAQLRARVISAPWIEISVESAIAGQHPAMTGGALWALESVLADPAEWLGAEEQSLTP
jgi:predicted NBD/HSP70 family sugar kinase